MEPEQILGEEELPGEGAAGWGAEEGVWCQAWAACLAQAAGGVCWALKLPCTCHLRNPVSPFKRCLVANLPFSPNQGGVYKGLLFSLPKWKANLWVGSPTPRTQPRPLGKGDCVQPSAAYTLKQIRRLPHTCAAQLPPLEVFGTLTLLFFREIFFPRGATSEGLSLSLEWILASARAHCSMHAHALGEFSREKEGLERPISSSSSKWPVAPPLFLERAPLLLGMSGIEDSSTAGKWIYFLQG